MEDDATGPGPEIGPAQNDQEIQQRLQKLEAEAQRLREQMSSGQAAPEQISPGQPEKPVELPPPTRAQLDQADRLIQQARLAKTRGQTGQMANFLKQAEQAAPNAPTVLEFIGDQFLEQKRYRDAQAVYKRAFDLDPKNVGLERKWAQSIAAVAPMGDPMMMSEYESMASGKIASILSAFLPGLGQVVLGEFAKGAAIFGVWAGMILWLYLIPSGLKGIVALFSQRASQEEPFHAIVLVPMFIMFIVWISSIYDAKMTSGLGRKPISHPIPPDDKPFE